MDDEDGKGNGKDDDLTQAVVVAILKCLTSEVVKLALLQWVVLMMMVNDDDQKYKKDENEANLKKAAVEVCNVDHAAARLITSHLISATLDWDQNTCFQTQTLQTSSKRVLVLVTGEKTHPSTTAAHLHIDRA